MIQLLEPTEILQRSLAKYKMHMSKILKKSCEFRIVRLFQNEF